MNPRKTQQLEREGHNNVSGEEKEKEDEKCERGTKKGQKQVNGPLVQEKPK